jgi:periplasmic protein TonB
LEGRDAFTADNCDCGVAYGAVSAFAYNAPTNQEEWAQQLVAHLNKYKGYSHHHALVVIQFVIDRSGDLVYAKSSGDPAIDSAALAIVRHARPLPVPPSSVTDEQLHITVPIRFTTDAATTTRRLQ